jgi:large subunit ribosomal protein L24
MKIKKNDTVQIIHGKDRGKKGKVLQVFPKVNKIVVEGINMMAKNVRPKKMGEKGQVVRYNAPIDGSNALVYCSACRRPVKIGIIKDKAGKKIRLCRKCKQAI